MSAELFKKVLIWASSEDAVRVVIMEGSRARPDHAVDRFSDYDLDLYVTDVMRYIADDAWLKQFGVVWAMEEEIDLSGESSQLVLFEGGHGVDFKFAPVATLHELIRQQSLPVDYHRGYQVILDKDRITSQLPQPAHKVVPVKRPSEDEFLYAVNVFWFELFHLVKYLHRDELWSVKFRDATIKRRLLQMIEWHAQASHEWEYDTWIVGKHMQAWVEPEIWQAFFEIFARFDKEDSWRAVCALMPLYRRLASETARHLNYSYLYEMDKAISTFLLENNPV